jgi:hypothetical protein
MGPTEGMNLDMVGLARIFSLILVSLTYLSPSPLFLNNTLRWFTGISHSLIYVLH